MNVSTNPDDPIFAIPALFAWWRAGDLTFTDAGVTPCTNGQPVQEWWSKTNNYKAIQVTGSSKPTYSTNSFTNDVPSVCFDGGDFMPCAMGTVWGQSNQAFFVCIRTNTDTSSTFLVDGTNAASRWAIFTAGNNNYNLFAFAGSSTSSATDSWATNHWEWQQWNLSGGDVFVFSSYFQKQIPLNVAPGVSSVSIDGAVLGGRIDGAADWCGRIAEILLFHGPFDISNRNTISNYFKSRYGL